MKATLLFLIVLVVVVVGLGLLLGIPFSAPAEREAIRGSAVVAIVVQVFAFLIARLTSKTNYLAGWVIGVALRFVALVAYAFVAVKGMGLSAPAALLSLATFLFVSTLLESKFIAI